MPDIFLSYSREDQAIARRVIQALEREGFSVWWDQALNAGEAFDKATEKALDESRAVVVLWSQRSVSSDWVRAEATQAHASQRLVPAMIEACRRPIMFELVQTADLIGWQGDSSDERWRTFVASLKRLVDGADGARAASAPAGNGTVTRAGSSAAPRRTTTSQRAWIAAAVVALALLAGALFWNRQAPRAVVSPAAPTGQQSIAVLPFDDLSPDKDQGYFADGVAEEILNQLAKVDSKQLRVIARNSSFAMRGKSVSETSTTLNVGHVLEGSVRRDGDKLRVLAQLINASTDAPIWSKTYDSERQGIFKVQEDIARSVAEALQVSLGIGIGQQRGMTRDVEAYDLYLRGTSEAIQFSLDSWQRAIRLMEEAVRRDPSFATAWLTLSGAYSRMPTFVAGNEAQWRERSDAALERVRQLLPDSPEYHLALAQRSALAGNLLESLAHQEDARAAARRLGLPEGEGVPQAMLNFGWTSDAAAALEALKLRDPLDGGIAFYLAHAMEELGQTEAAFAETERGYALGGPWQPLMASAGIMTALGSRDRRSLDIWLQRAIALPAIGADNPNARRLALLDKPKEMLAQLHMEASDPAATPVQLVSIAPWLAYFGDAEGALQALRAARKVSQGESILWSSVYRDMRKLPAFKELLRDEGWPDVWRKTGKWGDFCKPTTGDDFECR